MRGILNDELSFSMSSLSLSMFSFKMMKTSGSRLNSWPQNTSTDISRKPYIYQSACQSIEPEKRARMNCDRTSWCRKIAERLPDGKQLAEQPICRELGNGRVEGYVVTLLCTGNDDIPRFGKVLWNDRNVE